MKKASYIVILLLFCMVLSGCTLKTMVNSVPTMQKRYEIVKNNDFDNILRMEERLIKTESNLFYLEDKFDLSDSGFDFKRNIPYLIRIDRVSSQSVATMLPSTNRSGVRLFANDSKLLFWGTDGERAIFQLLNFNLEVEREIEFPLAENGICVATNEDAIFIACQNAVYKATFDQGVVSQYYGQMNGVSCLQADGDIVMLGVQMPDQSAFLRILDFSESPRLLKDFQEMTPISIVKKFNNNWIMIGGAQKNYQKLYVFDPATLQLTQLRDLSSLIEKNSVVYFPEKTEEGMFSLLTQESLDTGNKSLLYLHTFLENEAKESFRIELPSDGILSNIEVSDERLYFLIEDRTAEKVMISEYTCPLTSP